MITNENSVGVSSNGANELMENVKINMSLTVLCLLWENIGSKWALKRLK